MYSTQPFVKWSTNKFVSQECHAKLSFKLVVGWNLCICVLIRLILRECTVALYTRTGDLPALVLWNAEGWKLIWYKDLPPKKLHIYNPYSSPDVLQHLSARHPCALPVPSHTFYTRLVFITSPYRFNPVSPDSALEKSASRYLLLPVCTPCP